MKITMSSHFIVKLQQIENLKKKIFKKSLWLEELGNFIFRGAIIEISSYLLLKLYQKP